MHIIHVSEKLYQDNRIYHVLIGALNPDKNAIKTLASGLNFVHIHERVSDMRELICGMDIAVSAAGSTLYEIAACGVPLITYILADNQIQGAEAFNQSGLAVNIGDLRTLTPEIIINKIMNVLDRLALDHEARIAMGEKMQALIDGSGTLRIAEKLLLFVK